MRLLYASERPPYPFFLGGAARCAHQLLLTLTHELGAQCVAVGSGDYRVSPWSYPDLSECAALGIRGMSQEGQRGSIDCGYPIKVFPDFPTGLGQLIDTFKPDVVWAQMEGAKSVLELAAAKGVQGLLFVHDAEFDPTELRAIGDLGSHVACSSGFLARKARRIIGRNAHVVYPCPETDFGVEGDRNGCMTMVNPHPVKGLATFLEIARKMPAERFLLVESWKLTDEGTAALNAQLADLPNVRFMRRVSDMRDVYRQTRLLLVPSIWEEGFGMVAIEAQSCRIPVIASARGGLPESVGVGGLLIEDYRNVGAWVEAIGEVLRDAGTYDGFAAKAHRHAFGKEFTASSSAHRFHEICSAKVRPPGRLSRGLRAIVGGLGEMPGLGRLIRRANR